MTEPAQAFDDAARPAEAATVVPASAPPPDLPVAALPPGAPVVAAVPAARQRVGGRVLRGTLLVAAVAVVVALDTVPLPFSTPQAAVRPVVSGATGTASSATAAQDEARDAAIGVTLDLASKALAARDVAGLVGVVDPAAATTVERVRTVGTNLAAYPSAEASLEWGGSSNDGRTPGEYVVHARLVTYLPPYDKAPTHDFVDVTLRESGRRWLVSTWEWGDTEEPPPWAVPGLQAVARPHVLILGEAKNRRLNERLAARAEAAVVDARQVWTTPAWNGRAVVTAVTDKDYLSSVFGPGAGPGGDRSNYFDVYSSAKTEGGLNSDAMRAIVATDFLLRDNRITRSDLRYLFTRLSFETSRNWTLPGWLYYGVADYTAWRPRGKADALETLRSRGLYDGTMSTLRSGRWKPQLTDSQEQFGEGSDAKAQADYDSAFLAIEFIVDTYGEATMRTFVEEVADGAGLDEAMRKHLHLTSAQFSAKLPAYAKRLVAKA